MRTLLLSLLGVAVVALAGATTIGLWLSTPAYRGPRSDHFDGKRFSNQETTEHGNFRDLMRWMWTREPGPWAEQASDPPGPPPLQRVHSGRLRVTWVNHATTLIQMDGLNILTDPMWSERASPVQWAGPRRFHAPGIAFEQLPPIDVVVLSHNHYDHLDIGTLRRLSREHRPRIFVPLGVRAFLERKGIPRAEEGDWWTEHPIGEGVRLTIVPAKHFSGRGLLILLDLAWK